MVRIGTDVEDCEWVDMLRVRVCQLASICKPAVRASGSMRLTIEGSHVEFEPEETSSQLTKPSVQRPGQE